MTVRPEFLVIGNNQITKQLNCVSHIRIGDSSVESVGDAKNIGAIIDRNLDLRKHVSTVCRTCYMHLNSI